MLAGPFKLRRTSSLLRLHRLEVTVNRPQDLKLVKLPKVLFCCQLLRTIHGPGPGGIAGASRAYPYIEYIGVSMYKRRVQQLQ